MHKDSQSTFTYMEPTQKHTCTNAESADRFGTYIVIQTDKILLYTKCTGVLIGTNPEMHVL